MAKLRTEAATTPEQILLAASSQERLLLIDPKGRGRQENRRQLCGLYIRAADEARLGSIRSQESTVQHAKKAVDVAEQIMTPPDGSADPADDSASSHRLLAMSLESVASSLGSSAALVSATTEYTRALARDPADWVSAERLVRIAYVRDSDLRRSDEVLDDLLKASPKSPQVRLLRYRFFATTNRLKRAREELETAIALAPTDPEIRMAAASEAIQRRDPNSARRHLDAIPARSRDERQIKKYLGFIELVENKADAAVETWRRGLLESRGRDRDLTWRMAYILMQLGRFAEAAPLIAQYRRLAGEDDPMLHLLMGIRDEMTGRPAAAIAELTKLAPSIDKAWHFELVMTLGRALERINEYERAAVEYRRAIKEMPRSLVAWRSLARLIKKSDPEAAAREIETALSHLPGDSSLLLDLAMIRLQEQLAKTPAERDWSQVNSVLEWGARAVKPDPVLVLVRAEMLSASGRFDEATKVLEKALEGPDRSRADLWLYLADGLAVRGRLTEALSTLERGTAPNQAGDQASLRVARATILFRLGKGQAARDLLTLDVEGLPIADRVEFARARARLLQILGDKAGARQAYIDVAKLAPGDPRAGLDLLELSRRNGDEEAARLGLDLIQSVNAESEPVALAARALDLLLSSRKMTDNRTPRLEKATALSRELMTRAPRLPVSHLVRGIIMERTNRVEEAIDDYRLALEGETAEMALDRLTQLYARLKRYDELVKLKDVVKVSLPLDRVAARLAIEQGDKEAAESLVSRLVESGPDDAAAYVSQALVLRELGKPEAAEKALRSAIERSRDRPDAWLALVASQASRGASAEAAGTVEQAKAEYQGPRPDLFIARLRWVADDRDAAAKLYDEATARNSDDLATYQAAFAFAQAAGQLDRAEALVRRALPVRSCSAWAARMLAILLSKRADPSSWKEAWTLVGPGGPGSGQSPSDRLLVASLLTLSPDPARRDEAKVALASLIADLPASDPIGLRARVDLASTLLGANNPAEAARYIAEATEESATSDPDILALAVEILAKAGKPDEADERLSRLKDELGSPTAACGRAWIWLAREKPEEAVLTIMDAASAAEKAADASAKHAYFFNQLIKMKQPEAAELLARKVARLWPKDSCLLAEFLGARGRTDESLEVCRTAVDAGATREPMTLVLHLVMSGKLDASQGEKARGIAEAVLASHAKDVGLLLQSASIANWQRRYDDALKACRRAFESEPSNPLCRNGLNDMAWIMCEDLGRAADALVEVERVLKVEASSSAMDTRGVILTRLGRLPEAIEQLEACVKKEAVGHRYLHLARAYQQAGKMEEYRGALERAKKAGINPAALGPKEREEFAAVIGR